MLSHPNRKAALRPFSYLYKTYCLIGKEQGDIVVIKTPGGEVEFEVLKVEYI